MSGPNPADRPVPTGGYDGTGLVSRVAGLSAEFVVAAEVREAGSWDLPCAPMTIPVTTSPPAAMTTPAIVTERVSRFDGWGMLR
jgi:hypothetical protein